MPKNALGRSLPLKAIGYVLIFLFLYILLPVFLFRLWAINRFSYLFLFYLANAVALTALINKNSARAYSLDSLIQQTQEKLNLLSVDYLKNQENNIALSQKHKRYKSLESILENINQSLELAEVADIFTSRVFSLIGKNKGVCVLYLVDNQTQKLALFKARKEDPELIVKSKEGDIFDFWVLRHAGPLLVEDIRNDFRFDPEKLKALDLRVISSLISAPFVSENKILGVIRLDNQEKNFFSQNDLRFLAAMADLGALSLENSELFQRTQDLAIHDALTSLFTKGYFIDRLKEESRRCLRQNTPLAMLMLDIDLFKNYNDKFGHTAGDIVLKKISQIIRVELANVNAIVSRFGGEEFSAAISGMDKRSACRIADSLREKIENEKIVLRRTESRITVSIGVANFPQDASDEDDLIRQADKALYKAKQKGRNRVCCI